MLTATLVLSCSSIHQNYSVGQWYTGYAEGHYYSAMICVDIHTCRHTHTRVSYRRGGWGGEVLGFLSPPYCLNSYKKVYNAITKHSIIIGLMYYS